MEAMEAIRSHQLNKRKACLQCTKSKRKCDRSYPGCLRCLDKGVDCQYPPSRRARHLHVSSGSEQSDVRTSSPRSFPPRPQQHLSRRGSLDDQSQDFLVNDRWFLTPDSFVKLLHDVPSPEDNATCAQYQQRILGDETVEFLETVQSWMKQWATEGHSPVVHRHLYSGGYMPECVEDAFTVLATYHSSTNPQIRKTALQIADRRASRLIASFRVPGFQYQSQDPATCQSIVIDTQTHLARTLALLTYQVMGLLDTDIRARSNAEDYIEILDSWAAQMLESARLDSLTADIAPGTPSTSPDNTPHSTTGHVSEPSIENQVPSISFGGLLEPACPEATSFMNMITMDEFLSFPSILPTDTSNTNSSSSSSPDGAYHKNPFILPPKLLSASSLAISKSTQQHHITSLHRAWLVAESVRRVYITAIYTQSVYMTLKRGAFGTSPLDEASICPGGMTFTARAGLWDAPSGYTWFNVVKKTVGAVVDYGEGEGDRTGSSGDGRKAEEKANSMLMLKTNEAWKVLEGIIPARPRDVDEFTRAILLICFGKEWTMERWLDLDGDGEKDGDG